MRMRKDFEMSHAQLETLMIAMKPVPMIMLQTGTPSSQQESANAAWQALGTELGFDHMTVRPNSKGDRFFTAEAIEPKPPCKHLSHTPAGICNGCGEQHEPLRPAPSGQGISVNLAMEIADNWEAMAAAEQAAGDPPARRETLRECADLVRMLATRTLP